MGSPGAVPFDRSFPREIVIGLVDAQGRLLTRAGDRVAFDGSRGLAIDSGRASDLWTVPVLDTRTGEAFGAIDLSGFAQGATGRAFTTALALVSRVRRMLSDFDPERRFAVVDGDITAGGWPLSRLALGGSRGVGSRTAASRNIVAMPGRDFSAGPSDRRVAVPSIPSATGVGSVRAPAARGSIDRRAMTRLPGRRRTDDRGAPRLAIEELVGSHPAIVAARRAATAAAAVIRPVLLVGEPGTGKRAFARAIHDGSEARAMPFVVVHCAALGPDATAVSPWTGANGTLFLDDVAALPPAAQEALLDTLRHPGGARVMFAAEDPRDERLAPALRETLDHALALAHAHPSTATPAPGGTPVAIHLPPLRERRTDVAELAHLFLDEAALDLGRPGLGFAPAVVAILARHPWTGNVRELRDQVRRMASVCTGGTITIGQLPPAILATIARAPAAAPLTGAGVLHAR